MFQRIVVPAALEHQETPAMNLAIRLTQRGQGDLTLVHVVEELPRYMRLADHRRARHLEELLVREAEDKLNAIARHWREQTPLVHVRVLRGHPVLELLREIERGPYDLLIKDRDLKDEMQTDYRLVRKSAVPVWLASPNDQSVAKILACVDPEPEDAYRNLICDRVITAASDLAKLMGAELHVLRSWSVFMAAAAIQHLPQYAFEEYKKEIERSLHMEFEYFLQRHANLDVVPHFVEGYLDVTVGQLVSELGIHSVVIGTSSHKPLASLFLGSTTERILETVSCSVLTVKAEDATVEGGQTLPEVG